ncbi:MAG: hypothetical protein IT324_08610 [Anaerolineae bacterium]|nr:hypothetical protein [Anaerolineae bacterium]
MTTIPEAPRIPPADPKGGCLSLTALLIAGVVSLIAIIAVLLFDPAPRLARLVQPTPVTPTTGSTRAVSLPTDVPTVTAVPPTATHTPTPTNTFTPSPTLPPTATSTATNTPLPPTPTPTRTPAPRTAAPAATFGAVAGGGSADTRCVAVVGDSVAHGDAVFEIPNTGFLQAQFLPVSGYINGQYSSRGVSNIKVFNRSASAVGISSGKHPSYFSTFEYAQLLQDACQYVVIIPWINDLSSGNDASAAAPAHVAALARLAQDVSSKNANSKVFVVNYYNGSPAPFALNTFATGFTPGNIGAFNQQIGAACAGGALALKQVVCVDANAIFGGMGGSHVIGPMNRDTYNQLLISPPKPDQEALVNAYFNNNPGGQIIGDGVHLSASGKSQLAAYLVGQMP